MNTKIQDITDYTSGPWEAKDQWGYIKIHSEGEGVCAVHGLGVNSQANARMIAAAPDLLDALKALMKCAVRDAEHYAPDGNELIWAFISDASDAISKAERGAM